MSHVAELQAAIADARSLLRGYQLVNNTTLSLPTTDALLSESLEPVQSKLTSTSNGAQPKVESGRDVVIGMAQDTEAKNLAVFCGSLRK